MANDYQLCRFFVGFATVFQRLRTLRVQEYKLKSTGLLCSPSRQKAARTSDRMSLVGAALCRARDAKRPQGLSELCCLQPIKAVAARSDTGLQP